MEINIPTSGMPPAAVSAAPNAAALPSAITAQFAAGDVVQAPVVARSGGMVTLNLGGAEFQVLLPALDPQAAQLLLKVKSTTAALVFELLSYQTKPPLPNQAQAMPASQQALATTQTQTNDASQTTRLPASAQPQAVTREVVQQVLQQLGLPATPANRTIVEQLMRYQVPVNRQVVQETLMLASSASNTRPEATVGERVQSVQYALLGSGVENPQPQDAALSFESAARGAALGRALGMPATPGVVSGLAGLLEKPRELAQQVERLLGRINSSFSSQPQEGAAPVSRSDTPPPLATVQRLVESLLARMDNAAQATSTVRSWFEEGAMQAIGGAKAAMEQTTLEWLRRDPMLERLRTLLQHVQMEAPDIAAQKSAPQADALQSVRALQQLEQVLGAKDLPAALDLLKEWTAQARREPAARERLQLLFQRLAEYEKTETERNPAVGELKALHQGLRSLEDRVHAVRMLDFTQQAEQRGIMVLEIPLQAQGGGETARLSVFTRKQGKPQWERGESFVVALDLSMSAVGEVESTVELSREQANVHFQLRDEAVQRLFSVHRDELTARLQELGVASTLDFSVRTPGRRAAPLPERLLPGREGGVDVRI